MHEVTCKVGNGMCVVRMNWLQPGHMCPPMAAGRVRTCTLRRSCAGRFLPEATATPRSRGQVAARPEARNPLV